MKIRICFCSKEEEKKEEEKEKSIASILSSSVQPLALKKSDAGF